MSSILDIDLDYFVFTKNPFEKLDNLLMWGNRPVDFIVNEHHKAFIRWKQYVRNKKISSPKYILHVDDHHDIMDDNAQLNIANFIFHAMKTWKDCKVRWLVESPIDFPDRWISEKSWKSIKDRFSAGNYIPSTWRKWRKPNIVTVCISPEFIDNPLKKQLLKVIKTFKK